MTSADKPIPKANQIAAERGISKFQALYNMLTDTPEGLTQHQLEDVSGWPAGTVRGWINNHRKRKKPDGYVFTTSKPRDAKGKPLKGSRVSYRLERHKES